MYHRSLGNFSRINDVVTGFTNCIFDAPSQHYYYYTL